MKKKEKIEEIEEIPKALRKDGEEKEKKKKRKASKLFNEAEKIVFSELKQGDYVVHKIHGIGQFVGVNTIVTDKTTKDYIKIKYNTEDEKAKLAQNGFSFEFYGKVNQGKSYYNNKVV